MMVVPGVAMLTAAWMLASGSFCEPVPVLLPVVET
jgi:hypothetical protein